MSLQKEKRNWGGLIEESKQPSIDGVEITEDQTVINNEHYHHHHHHSEYSQHHQHHRRHRHRSNSSKRKKNKFVTFLKKHRGVLVNILSCTISAVLLVVIALNIDFCSKMM